ncbi:MAG: toll/interleukin-1 receptor domain-containing protein [Pirellulaceae bacterium]
MQIFISHDEQDRDLARILAGQLQQAGFQVWDESREIYPGDNWAKIIGEALESSEVLVALVTRPQPASDSLARDVLFALTQGPNYRGRVVPVFVGQHKFVASPELPWVLLKLDPVYIATPAEGFDKVIERLQSFHVPA